MKNYVIAALLGLTSALFFVSPAHADDVIFTDNVVIIIDGSGSMRNEIDGKDRMTAAKFALLPALNAMPETTNFGCLTFSKDVSGWVYPIAPFNKKRVWDGVKKIEPGGNTPLGKFIKMGADALLAQREKYFNYGTYRLVVVTDGQASDSELMEQYAKELVQRGITLNVIGVGMRQAHSLKNLAHQYVAANNADALNDAITTFLAEVPDAPQNDPNAETFYESIGFFINDEVTLSVIDALVLSGNHPLGTAP